MSQHTPPHERQRDGFAEEDGANAGGHVGEGVSDTSYHNVLKEAGTLHEGAAVGEAGDIAFRDELVRDEEKEMG